MIINKEDNRKDAKKALENILSMDKRLSDDFNAEKELQVAREEKYDKSV